MSDEEWLDLASSPLPGDSVAEWIRENQTSTASHRPTKPSVPSQVIPRTVITRGRGHLMPITEATVGSSDPSTAKRNTEPRKKTENRATEPKSPRNKSTRSPRRTEIIYEPDEEDTSPTTLRSSRETPSRKRINHHHSKPSERRDHATTKRLKLVNRTTQTRATAPTRIENCYNPDCCWHCGETGHGRNECRNPGTKFCSKCGRIGLLSSACCNRRTAQ